MGLVVVASAKGAPGVTTLTVALGALTPGAIVADLDPDGGDLALRYGREDGAPLDPEIGLLSLAASLRRDHTEIASPTGPVEEHLQVASGGLEVLLGVTSPDQAVGLGPLWSPLARALAESDRTVFADCGRLGPASPAMPVLMQADAVLLLARAELEELAHLRERLRFLTATLPARYTGPARIGVVLVVRERDRAAAPRTEQLLRASGLAIPVLGSVTDDPRGAGRLRGLHGGRPGRSTLVRSVRSLLPAVTALTGHTLTVGILTEAALANAGPSNGTGPSRAGVIGDEVVATSPEPGPRSAAVPVALADRNGSASSPNGIPMTRADRLGRGRKRSVEPVELRDLRRPATTPQPPVEPVTEEPRATGPVGPAGPTGPAGPVVPEPFRPDLRKPRAFPVGEPAAETEPESLLAASNSASPPPEAAEPLPEPEPADGPGPETDVWLGTQAAGGPIPLTNPAPAHPSPYRPVWVPGPDSDTAEQEPVPGGELPQDATAVPEQWQEDQQAEHWPAEEQPEQWPTDQQPEHWSAEQQPEQWPTDQQPEQWSAEQQDELRDEHQDEQQPDENPEPGDDHPGRHQQPDQQHSDQQHSEHGHAEDNAPEHQHVQHHAPEQQHAEHHQAPEQQQAADQSTDDQASRPGPVENSSPETGWPQPGRGSETLSGVTATVLQNWGR